MRRSPARIFALCAALAAMTGRVPGQPPDPGTYSDADHEVRESRGHRAPMRDGVRPSAAGTGLAVRFDEDVRVPMTDGVTLAAKVFRPEVEGKKFPALMLLRYWQTGEEEAKVFTPHGYACVLVDCRGRGRSGGRWDPYVNEPRDGADALKWIAQQSWCDGKIGTFGQSYNAFTQLMPAPLAGDHLKCLFPVEGQQSNFGHLYNEGVMQWNVVSTFGLYTTGPTGILPHKPLGDPHFRRLPLLDLVDEFPEAAPHVRRWFEHERLDDYWKSHGILGKYDKIRAPAYLVTGWYDNLVHENWKNFGGLRKHGGSEAARKGTKIRVGPTAHGGAWGQFEEHLRWYDHWLKGVDNGIQEEPPITLFIMGADRWRQAHEWPLPQTRYTRLYLAGGKANSTRGDGSLATESPTNDAPRDRFVYDPADPVYTLGGQISTNPEVWGPRDRQSVQRREDVLVYTTAPLEEDTEVTGPVEVKLYAASDAVDTDFTATLTDVHPDGKAIHICEGIRGARYRESLEDPTPIEPGKVYEYTISLWETGQLFRAGHRIRLEISSSNFPRYARNQNTGLPLGTSDEIKKARQTIYRDAEHPSHLILPIIPREGAR